MSTLESRAMEFLTTHATMSFANPSPTLADFAKSELTDLRAAVEDMDIGVMGDADRAHNDAIREVLALIDKQMLNIGWTKR